jgi:hypothetical protein
MMVHQSLPIHKPMYLAVWGLVKCCSLVWLELYLELGLVTNSLAIQLTNNTEKLVINHHQPTLEAKRASISLVQKAQAEEADFLAPKELLEAEAVSLVVDYAKTYTNQAYLNSISRRVGLCMAHR